MLARFKRSLVSMLKQGKVARLVFSKLKYNKNNKYEFLYLSLNFIIKTIYFRHKVLKIELLENFKQVKKNGRMLS
jgi:hypothetical protein